jgi:hypothetical protein
MWKSEEQIIPSLGTFNAMNKIRSDLTRAEKVHLSICVMGVGIGEWTMKTDPERNCTDLASAWIHIRKSHEQCGSNIGPRIAMPSTPRSRVACAADLQSIGHNKEHGLLNHAYPATPGGMHSPYPLRVVRGSTDRSPPRSAFGRRQAGVSQTHGSPSRERH